MRLRAATMLAPMAQGELDGLCGLYAIINAVRLAIPSTVLAPRETERLFRVGIEWLDARGLLPKAVRWGLGQTAWRQLAAHIATHVIGARAGALTLVPLLPPTATDTSTAIRLIERAIVLQQPVLALIREAYYHYTVIAGVTATRLTLFDSYGYHWLERRACSFTRQSTPTRHRFAPRSLLALQWLPAVRP